MRFARLAANLTRFVMHNQPSLSVMKGNPALKPAVTRNFDLGVELHERDVGAIKLNVFYKSIRNLAG